MPLKKSEINNDTPWIKPLGCFEARAMDNQRLEIPYRIYAPLRIGEGDVVQIAYVYRGADEMLSCFATVGVRRRISLKSAGASPEIPKGIPVTCAILSIFECDIGDALVLFDLDLSPEWRERK